mgnify:CR=1 FL=1
MKNTGVVFKYEVQRKIEMPKGSEILCMQMQRGIPCIWAMVHQTKEMEIREFDIIGTGQAIIGDLIHKYIGTYQPTEFLVYHVFEVIEE